MEERIFDFLNASGILVVDIKGFIKDSCLFSNEKRVEEVKSFSLSNTGATIEPNFSGRNNGFRTFRFMSGLVLLNTMPTVQEMGAVEELAIGSTPKLA
jgi:hypothetical protein